MDTSFAGRVYPPSQPYEVGREKIREFADAVGAAHPAHRDPAVARALGYPDVIAPTTFAIIVTTSAADVVVYDPLLGLDYTRVVHRDQRFVQRRPLHAGDVVTVTVTVESARIVAGNALLSTRGDVYGADGELITSAYASLVSRAVQL
ncbi:MAG: putative acyl dehydratase [Pseudonocardiales bacterium]|nr:putative acyl dehydratase [Pseudonocardiales bacterium]